jgi:hypothetical protein
LVSLFLLMKYGCHVQVGIELLCKWFSNPSCDLFHPGFRYTGKSAKENPVFHTVCCETMFPTSSNIIFVSCFFQRDNMALWVWWHNPPTIMSYNTQCTIALAFKLSN